MKKEPMTIHIEPLLRYALAEIAASGNYKNINTFVTEVLTKQVKKINEDKKIFLELDEIKSQLSTISQVLEIMATNEKLV